MMNSREAAAAAAAAAAASGGAAVAAAAAAVADVNGENGVNVSGFLFQKSIVSFNRSSSRLCIRASACQ